MDFKVRIFFCIAIIVYLFAIIYLLKKRKLDLKYTLLWLVAGAVLLIVTIFPGIMYSISDIIGIQTPINSAFVLGCMFIIIILITITSIVSALNKNLRVLIQEVALLEKRVRQLEEKRREADYERE